MKKFCITALSILMMGTSSLTLTSCDTEDLGNIISGILESGILGQLFGGQTGTTYTYTISEGEALAGIKSPDDGYDPISGSQISIEGVTFDVKDCGTTANITLPALTLGSAAMSSVTLSGLHMESVEGGSYISITLPEDANIYVEGNLTVEGKQYPLKTAFIEPILVSTADFGSGQMQFFFGENCEYVVNIEGLVGNIVTPQN